MSEEYERPSGNIASWSPARFICLRHIVHRYPPPPPPCIAQRYDASIAEFFSSVPPGPQVEFREYQRVMPLKYGVNPHQKPASVCSIGGKESLKENCVIEGEGEEREKEVIKVGKVLEREMRIEKNMEQTLLQPTVPNLFKSS